MPPTQTQRILVNRILILLILLYLLHFFLNRLERLLLALLRTPHHLSVSFPHLHSHLQRLQLHLLLRRGTHLRLHLILKRLIHLLLVVIPVVNREALFSTSIGADNHDSVVPRPHQRLHALALHVRTHHQLHALALLHVQRKVANLPSPLQHRHFHLLTVRRVVVHHTLFPADGRALLQHGPLQVNSDAKEDGLIQELIDLLLLIINGDWDVVHSAVLLERPHARALRNDGGGVPLCTNLHPMEAFLQHCPHQRDLRGAAHKPNGVRIREFDVEFVQVVLHQITRVLDQITNAAFKLLLLYVHLLDPPKRLVQAYSRMDHTLHRQSNLRCLGLRLQIRQLTVSEGVHVHTVTLELLLDQCKHALVEVSASQKRVTSTLNHLVAIDCHFQNAHVKRATSQIVDN